MTDKEIVKAKKLLKKLEEAYNAYYDTSKGMPYDLDTTIRETAICLEHSIDEINSQKAEIERLKELNAVLETDNFNANMNLEHIQQEIDLLKQEKSVVVAETIKKFESKLISRILKDIDEQGLMPLPYTKKAYDKVIVFIKHLVKEMTENQ